MEDGINLSSSIFLFYKKDNNMVRKKDNTILEVNNTVSNSNLFADICDTIGNAEILTNSNLEYISTGNFALDYIISDKFVGGGVPLGRIVEIYGESSTGKTVIGTHLLQGVQK